MTAEQRPDIQLGTGSPRSELDDDVRQDGPTEPSSDTALHLDSNPALPDDVEANRSGSGGTGGEEEPRDESMAEILGNGAGTAGRP